MSIMDNLYDTPETEVWRDGKTYAEYMAFMDDIIVMRRRPLSEAGYKRFCEMMGGEMETWLRLPAF